MKRLLLITGDPNLSRPASAPVVDPAQVKAAHERVEAALRDVGVEVTNCKIDLGERAETILRQSLSQGSFDCVLIGMGIRTLPEYTALFEMLVNVVHREAPGAKFAFNASIDSTPEDVLRAMGGR